MEIMNYVDLFLGALLNVIFNIIIVKKVFNIKTIDNKYKKWAYIILNSIVLTIINIFNKNIFKGVLTFPITAICLYKIFDIKITKSIYCSLVLSFYLLIGEVFATFILSILNIKYDFLATNFLGKTIGNILVILATTPLLYIKFISKIFIKLQTKKLNTKTLTIVFIIFLAIGSAFVFNGLTNIENIIPITMNLIIFSVFIVLLYFSYLESRKVNKISEEYNSLLDYLDKYEKEIVEKRKLVHDFKNQLIIINGYAEDSIKLKEYLNGIIEEHKNIKETKIVKNVDKLPKGLKGLMYYKLSQVDNKINIELNVKSKFRGFEALPSKDNRNILKIIGILIDNAIESCIKTEDKYILIEVSMNKGIFKMNILNSCSNKIEKSKIMESGFSTKGDKRGYGLSLARDIIKNDDRYSLSFDITDGEFKTNFHVNTK